jgi:hypothetical protein
VALPGSITAALFLRRFAAEARAYAHFDIYAWSASDAPGRPKGGLGQGARALFDALPKVLPMTRDPRTTPSNGRFAHMSLKGKVEAESFVDGTWMTVQQPIANLAHEPGGNRASQLLFGERFLVLEVADGQAFGQSERDGYVGWVSSAALTQAPEATHWVIAPATHLYPRADFKTQAEVALFFGSAVHVTAERQGYHRIQTGHFVPRQHLMPIAARFDDPWAWPTCSSARHTCGVEPVAGASTARASCNWRSGPAARLARVTATNKQRLWARTSKGTRFSAATWCSGMATSA